MAPVTTNVIPSYPVINLMRSINVSSALSRTEGRKEADRQLKELGIDKESKRQFILTNLTKEPKSGTFVWQLNLQTLENSYEDIIRSICNDLMDKQYDGPVLFVAGGQSTFLG